MVNENSPTYNLKAVVQETGLKPDTLRAWERRYGVPDPHRTGGGHRLYSQQDINTLKWLLARQAEGMSISRAVGLWRSLKEDNRDPLQVYPLPQPLVPDSTYSAPELGDTVIDLRNAWIDACMAFDERQAERVLTQAFSYYSPEVVCFELLQKALVEIGNGWYEGSVSVQQEHFASALAMRRLDSLLSATPAPTRTGRIIVGCPPGDNHTFSPLLVTYLLRRRGWDVVYLGADIPINRLLETIEQTKPDLVVFSSQLLETAASLLEVARYLLGVGVPLAYGGFVFGVLPELRNRIPGHFLGYELNKSPQIIENLVINRPPVPSAVPASDDYLLALPHFRERAGRIEAYVWQLVDQLEIDSSHIADANRYMTQNIIAALKLGDLNYIGAGLHWVEGMMINYNMPPENLHKFLSAYHMASEIELEEGEGRLITDWLEKVVAISEETTVKFNQLKPIAS
jgi:MerR family transcriptional regulator, light-induced transcriptional regulator